MTIIVLFENTDRVPTGAIVDTLGSGRPIPSRAEPRQWWLPSTGLIDRPQHAPPGRFPAMLLRKILSVSINGERLPVLVCGDVNDAARFGNLLSEEVVRQECDTNSESLIGTPEDAGLEIALHDAFKRLIKERPNASLGLAVPGKRWITIHTEDIRPRTEYVSYFGKITLMGTGVGIEEILQPLRERGSAYSDQAGSGDANSRLPTDLIARERIRNMFRSYLLALDRSERPKSLENLFGGYYEGYVAADRSLDEEPASWTIFCEFRWEDDRVSFCISGIWFHYYKGSALRIVSAPKVEVEIDDFDGVKAYRVGLNDIAISIADPLASGGVVHEPLAGGRPSREDLKSASDASRKASILLRLSSRSPYYQPVHSRDSETQRMSHEPTGLAPQFVIKSWYSSTASKGGLFELTFDSDGLAIRVIRCQVNHYVLSLKDAIEQGRA